jgi:hypothetical protein
LRAPATLPPTRVLVVESSREMPTPLPSGSVPVTSVPRKFPWIRSNAELCVCTPFCRLPEMRLRAPAAVPPIWQASA